MDNFIVAAFMIPYVGLAGFAWWIDRLQRALAIERKVCRELEAAATENRIFKKQLGLDPNRRMLLVQNESQ